MSIGLCRIDERLLHGQVLVGWGSSLGIDYYIVVDDELAASTWEQELYRSGAPRDVEVVFITVEEAVRRFPALEERRGRGALLTRETGAMRRLAESGRLRRHRVNVGGIHAAPGRRKALDYVYLGQSEEEDLVAIRRSVEAVSARDLPTSPEVPLEELRRAARRS